MPSQLMLYLQLLVQVADALGVTHVERKGGGTEEVDDERYMVLLWGFKQLETLFEDSKGITLRSEYGILWYESDWIIGKK